MPTAELLEGKLGAVIVTGGGYGSDRVSLVEAQGGQAVIPPRSPWSGRRELDRGLRRRNGFRFDRRERHRRITARRKKPAGHHLGMAALALPCRKVRALKS